MKRINSFLLLSLVAFSSVFSHALPVKHKTPKSKSRSQERTAIQAVDWFNYAKDDLRAANTLTRMDEPLLGIALYHVEQAVEKGLKAYLIAHKQKFALVHDLPPLLTACQYCDGEFSKFQADVKEINPYSTKSRYPNKSFIMPSKAFVLQLIYKAAQLLVFVRAKMA